MTLSDVRERPQNVGGVESDGSQGKSLPVNDGHCEKPKILAVALSEGQTVPQEYSSVMRHHQSTVEKIKEQHVQQQNIAPVSICKNNLSVRASRIIIFSRQVHSQSEIRSEVLLTPPLSC